MENAALTAPDPAREGITTTDTERNWPKNCWWVAAHSSELGEKPILRWVLELPIALCRTADGTPAALHNRCPHRWAPLSMGEVQGDRLVRPYHGPPFDFDATRAMSDIVFGEDIAMVEAMQDMAQRSIDHDEAREFSVAADRAAIEARRRILAMFKTEQGE
jgi:nitrite reductase/ring-hydroxylating ferredoxin subunit